MKQAWRVHENNSTLHKYGLTLAKFLISILRSQNSNNSNYKFPLTDNQIRLASELYACCQSNHLVVPALHALSLNLFSMPPFEIAIDKWQCSLMCYLALDNLHEDGRFTEAHNLTSNLAHWEYIIRAVTLYEAERTKNNYRNSLIG